MCLNEGSSVRGMCAVSIVCPGITIRNNRQGKAAVTHTLATLAGSLRTLNTEMLLLIRTEGCWPNGHGSLSGALFPVSAVKF